MATFRAYLTVLLMAWLVAPAAADSVALIITAETYSNASPLKNPKSDGYALQAILQGLGFEVTLTGDAGLSTMRKAIARLQDDAVDADDVLIFFAGHGVSFEGESRLLPTDADLSSRPALTQTSVALADALAAVGAAKRLGMVFSDACRNDPFLSDSPDGSRSVRVLTDGSVADAGLGLPDKDEMALLRARATRGGTYLVGLSTGAGKVAFDGRGLNSPFTEALVHALATSRDADEITRTIAREVEAATNGRQKPAFTIWRAAGAS